MRQYFHYFLAEQSTRFYVEQKKTKTVGVWCWPAVSRQTNHIGSIRVCILCNSSTIQLYIPVVIYYFLNQSIMASPSSSEFSHIIDWTEAMEQCGDDEEFLHELLSDLRGEIDAQIVKIDEVLNVSVR